MIRAMMTAVLVLHATTSLAAPFKTVSTGIGDVLTASDGRTLYKFSGDTTGTSNCNEGCIENWPPFLAVIGDSSEEAFNFALRDDGYLQWTQDGMPLYFWKGDLNTGDIGGEGQNGQWRVARPAEAEIIEPSVSDPAAVPGGDAGADATDQEQDTNDDR